MSYQNQEKICLWKIILKPTVIIARIKWIKNTLINAHLYERKKQSYMHLTNQHKNLEFKDFLFISWLYVPCQLVSSIYIWKKIPFTPLVSFFGVVWKDDNWFILILYIYSELYYFSEMNSMIEVFNSIVLINSLGPNSPSRFKFHNYPDSLFFYVKLGNPLQINEPKFFIISYTQKKRK